MIAALLTNGFYLVVLDGRKFDVCLVGQRNIPVFVRAHDSEPIPWELIEKHSGDWYEADPFRWSVQR